MWYTIFLLVVLYYGHNPANADVQDAAVRFSVELIQTVLNQESGNIIISPVSVHTMLAMLQQGAGGNTKEQLDRVIHADANVTREAYHNLTRHYQQSGPFNEIEFASKMFMRTGFEVLPQFRELLVRDFVADIESLDFSNHEAAVQHVNSWIAESTHNHITELFQPDQITSESILMLVNAVYFKSYFDNPFWESSTENKTFNISPSEEIQVPTMYQQEYYNAGESSELGAKWLHIDFLRSDDYSMLLVLPKERHHLCKLKNLTHENWSSIFSHQGYKLVKVSLPKFSLKTKTELIPVLKTLGVENIFEDTANLSGITSDSIKVSDFLQKATIDVDEHGVTASAATGVVIVKPVSAIFIPNAQEMEFIADQPFLVFIIDRIHGLPLFAGRVSNPLDV